MAQNSDLEARRKDFKMVHLDENLKNELRTSHFILGNSTPSYQTVFQTQFNKNDLNDQNKNLFSHNTTQKALGHKMGNDKIEYTSETHLKYQGLQSHQRANSFNQ
jgi:hypothetical protein